MELDSLTQQGKHMIPINNRQLQMFRLPTEKLLQTQLRSPQEQAIRSKGDYLEVPMWVCFSDCI